MGRGAWSVASWLLVAGGLLSACGPTREWGGALPSECQGGLHAEEDGLPVFHLFLSGALPDEDGYFPARLAYRGRCYSTALKYRGDTSRAFPKRSYTLEFPRSAPFEEPLQAGGFTGRRKVVLISPFNDNSYMRSRLAFELWRRMSPDHFQVKAWSAVLYVNGEYLGLYTVADHINEHLLASYGLDEDGELFKAVEQEANFSRRTRDGQPKLSLSEGYEKKAGEPETGPGAYDSIQALTVFVSDSSAETFRAEWASWLDTRDYEDWWIFSTLLHTDDSVAKNAYHYRARGPLARWRFIPWDLDASLGQNWMTVRVSPDLRSDFTVENHLFARMLADPSLAGPLRERYRTLLRNELRAEEVLALIDQLERELAPAAHRDEARWGEAHRGFWRWNERTDFNSFDEEVEYLRQWVRTRWSLLEQQLP